MRAFAWFLALMALALAAIAVFSYPAWMLLHPYFDFPFHRVGERIGMLALLVGFLLVARHLRLADRVSLGYGLARRAFLREMSLALILGVASMLAVVGLMSALGLLEWTPAARLSGTDLLRLVALRVVSGFAVAFIEETFLRGAMHSAIERDSGPRLAVLLTALLYAGTHFLASYHIAPAQVTRGLLARFKLLGTHGLAGIAIAAIDMAMRLGVNPRGHAAEVLDLLKRIKKCK